MERQNSKHSPRVDDQLAHETRSLVQGEPIEAHSREDLQQEGPVGRVGNRPDPPGTPDGFDEDTVELRSVLAASLRPSAFPADRQALLAVASEENAPQAVLRLLTRLPEGVSWNAVEEIWEEAGGPGEHRHLN